MKNDSNIHPPQNLRQSKDTQYLCNKKQKPADKNTIFLKRTKIVYDQFCKEVGTVNMVRYELQRKGYEYTYQEVRQSLLYLVNHKYIYYWGKDKCECTGRKAYWFDMPVHPKKKFNPKNDLRNAR